MSASLSFTPTTYDISLLRDGFAVVEVYANGFGRNVVERGFDCEAAADAHIDELLAAEREEAAAQAQADADNAAIDAELAGKLAQSASDLLHALDRGYFGNGHLFSDGSESAFVSELRDRLTAYRAATVVLAQKAA